MQDLNFTLKYTSVFYRMAVSTKPIFVLEGSSGSSKTISAIQYIILQCIKAPLPIVCRSFRVDAVDARQAMGEDFKKIMSSQCPDIWNGGKTYNKQEACFTFPNGSKYYFAGCDPARLPGYRQHIAHLDEATKINYDSNKQIAMRTKAKMIYSYNPDVTHHWLFKAVLGQNTETNDLTIRNDKVEYIHSTYKDNIENLTQVEIDEIECTNPDLGLPSADPWYWKVYGEGKRARREGAIYDRWEIVEHWPERSTCQRFGYGLDFGFSNDPTALIECALHQDFLYVRQVIYETNLVTATPLDNPNVSSIQSKLEDNEIIKTDKIFADARYPSDITTLQYCGYNVQASKTGAEGRIQSGINKVKEYQIRVHIDSVDIQKELENYIWDPKKSNEPVDKNNHALDAIRYFAIDELDQSSIVGQEEQINMINNLEFVSEWDDYAYA